jgi:hypothetical protein
MLGPNRRGDQGLLAHHADVLVPQGTTTASSHAGITSPGVVRAGLKDDELDLRQPGH